MANLMVLTNIPDDAQYVTISAPASTLNGYLYVLGAKAASGVYAAATPAAITDLNVVMVAAVCLPYAAETVENDFTIATGDTVRALVPSLGMEVAIPVANVTATATVAAGAFVIIDASTGKPECVASLGGTESLAFKVTGTFTKAGVAMFNMRCIKAQV